MSTGLNAQTSGTNGGIINFNTLAFGGQVAHVESGSFGSFGGNDQWIGIGQPRVSPFGPKIDAYGMRIQWDTEVAIFSLNGEGAGRDLDIQWGSGARNLDFRYINNPAGGAAGTELVMSLTQDETVGIRNDVPDYNLSVNHDRFTGLINGGGLQLENEFDGDNWVLYTSQSTNDLRLYYNQSNVGNFDDATGNYNAVSDRRLKKDIKSLDNVTDRIMQLRPTTYLFKTQKENEERNYGLIAQELREVFPEMVSIMQDDDGDGQGIQDLHTVSYSELIPVLIKGMQEQNEVIAAQQAEIDALKNSLNQSGKLIGSELDPALGSNFLYQNTPNPFNAFTTIRYSLTEGINAASIYIFDLNGRQVMTYDNLTAGEGEVTVAANELEPGMYLYSLVIDGQEAATKRMIITK
ncbi:MAG: tail fiber domain-containing protein [Bacteroidota bacterium]